MTVLPPELPPFSRISDVDGILGNISEFSGNLDASGTNHKFKAENDRIIQTVWERFKTEYPQSPFIRLIDQPTSQSLKLIDSALRHEMRNHQLDSELQEICSQHNQTDPMRYIKMQRAVHRAIQGEIDDDLIFFWECIVHLLPDSRATVNFPPLEVRENRTAAQEETWDREQRSTTANQIRAWFEAHRNRLEHITTIDINDCDLSELPPEIKYFTGLRDINLSGNCLFWLPDEICQLTELRILDLAVNKDLGSLPAGIGNLRNLHTICLDYTSIRHLPQEMGHLPLRTLTINATPIRTLPHTFRNLHLEEFRASRSFQSMLEPVPQEHLVPIHPLPEEHQDDGKSGCSILRATIIGALGLAAIYVGVTTGAIKLPELEGMGRSLPFSN